MPIASDKTEGRVGRLPVQTGTLLVRHVGPRWFTPVEEQQAKAHELSALCN